MVEVISISFIDGNKSYYFSPNGLKLKKGMNVIVETERGMQFANVVDDIKSIEEDKLIYPLKIVSRIASKEDKLQNEKNIKDAIKAKNKCNELIKKQELNMKIIDASYTFDRSQLVFRFVSDNRIDFRNLAKELASIYKTRIELRQVGVRDKAKEVGGIGQCGRKLCCSSFLNDFDSVSINMAKNQGIALNPSKINGVCGRLLCCLKYEDDNYKNLKNRFPKVGSKVQISEGEGSVVSINMLKGSYVVYITNIGPIEVFLDDES